MTDYTIEINGKPVQLGNLEKVFWPEKGYRKGDLLKYYLDISNWVLPYLKDRPIVMKRYPDGIAGKSFYQKRCPEYAPPWLETTAIEGKEGTIRYCLCNDAASLAWLVNQGCIEMHPWLSKASTPSIPDVMVLDLDPSEGVPFSQVIEVAIAVKGCLEDFGLVGVPKTSGATGIHIFVPVKGKYNYSQVRKAAETIAGIVAARYPSIATVERNVNMRSGKVYVDYLQNVQGKTIASVYSVRPVPTANVSTPLTWEEVLEKDFTPEMFTMETILPRLKEKGDLNSSILESKFLLDHILGEKKKTVRRLAGKT